MSISPRHTIAVLVDNEPGVLARVVGLFSGRGYNIESLTVAETDLEHNLSRITIVTTGTPMIIEQIKAQLARLVPVHNVTDLTLEGKSVERELALVKVVGAGDVRVESLRTLAAADAFGDAAEEIFERFTAGVLLYSHLICPIPATINISRAHNV